MLTFVALQRANLLVLASTKSVLVFRRRTGAYRPKQTLCWLQNGWGSWVFPSLCTLVLPSISYRPQSSSSSSSSSSCSLSAPSTVLCIWHMLACRFALIRILHLLVHVAGQVGGFGAGDAREGAPVQDGEQLAGCAYALIDVVMRLVLRGCLTRGLMHVHRSGRVPHSNFRQENQECEVTSRRSPQGILRITSCTCVTEQQFFRYFRTPPTSVSVVRAGNDDHLLQ